jgi:hypothetical protein
MEVLDVLRRRCAIGRGISRHRHRASTCEQDGRAQSMSDCIHDFSLGYGEAAKKMTASDRQTNDGFSGSALPWATSDPGCRLVLGLLKSQSSPDIPRGARVGDAAHRESPASRSAAGSIASSRVQVPRPAALHFRMEFADTWPATTLGCTKPSPAGQLLCGPALVSPYLFRT